MIHTQEEISKKFEQRYNLKMLEHYERKQEVDSHNFDCSLHSSMFYLFQMPEVESFIRNKLREYIRKEIKDDKYGYIHFFIDVDKLEEHCMGNAPYKLWKFKEDVVTQIKRYEEQDLYEWGHTDTPTGSSDICKAYDPFYSNQENKLNASDESENSVPLRINASVQGDLYCNEEMKDGLTYGQIYDTDAWEQIEIVVLTNEMAVFVSTWNFITRDHRFPYSKPNNKTEEEAIDKPAVQEREEKQVYRLNNILPIKISMTPSGECSLKYNNSLSMLFDVIINEALENNEITFIYPSIERGIAKTNYQYKGWEIDDCFCNSNADLCFKLVDFDSCYEITEQTKRDTILNSIESFVVAGNAISKENQYDVNDECHAWSIPNGQAIVFFDGKVHGDYEDYKLSFLHAIYSKTECTLLGMEFVSDLKKEGDNPNLVEEEKSMKLLRKLKILENDTNQDVSIISENSIEPLWLKKTNTLKIIENFEKVTTFLTKREEIDKEKKSQRILSFINILNMVAIISYVLDGWEMIGKKPAGGCVLVIVLIGLALLIFGFYGAILNKGKKHPNYSKD